MLTQEDKITSIELFETDGKTKAQTLSSSGSVIAENNFWVELIIEIWKINKEIHDRKEAEKIRREKEEEKASKAMEAAARKKQMEENKAKADKAAEEAAKKEKKDTEFIKKYTSAGTREIYYDDFTNNPKILHKLYLSFREFDALNEEDKIKILRELTKRYTSAETLQEIVNTHGWGSKIEAEIIPCWNCTYKSINYKVMVEETGGGRNITKKSRKYTKSKLKKSRKSKSRKYTKSKLRKSKSRTYTKSKLKKSRKSRK